MATFKFTGIDEYMNDLQTLGNKAEGLCKRALYDGAAVVADAVRAEVSSMPSTDVNTEPQQILDYEKQGLLDGLGVSKMRNENGVIYTRVDFDGYNRLKSKQFPNGHPNSMVARAINSGTSRRPKNPFMNRAVKKAKAAAQKAMASRLDADIEKIMK